MVTFLLLKNPILLLTGPAGAGKTATVATIAKSMQCEVQEWSNPSLEEFGKMDVSWEDAKGFAFLLLLLCLFMLLLNFCF